MFPNDSENKSDDIYKVNYSVLGVKNCEQVLVCAPIMSFYLFQSF